MSPRKSSTSSGRRSRRRPRYLGIEVAGEPFPLPPNPQLETLLRASLDARHPDPPRVRVIRADGRRAIVEVDHSVAAAARAGWNGPLGSLTIRTERTWGTLVGAKAWLAARPANRARPRTSRS